MKKRMRLTEGQLHDVILSAFIDEMKRQNRLNKINEELIDSFNGGYNAPRVYEWEVNDGNVEGTIDMRCNIENAIDSLRFVLIESASEGLHSYACFGPDTGETGDTFNISLLLYFRDDINKSVRCDLRFEADFYKENDEQNPPFVTIRDMRVLNFELALESYDDDPEFEQKLQQLKENINIQDTLNSLIDDTIE